MRNVMKYLGIMSVSLACAGPLFATSVQPFASVTVVQQSVVTVKGQVVDEKGEPIIGANVIVEGTTNGMITNLEGNFSLQCPVGSTLKTSYIGYLARTVKVTGNMNALKITLKEDTETLDEVVVVGYGTMKKSDLTGSVASVNAEEMARNSFGDGSDYTVEIYEPEFLAQKQQEGRWAKRCARRFWRCQRSIAFMHGRWYFVLRRSLPTRRTGMRWAD